MRKQILTGIGIAIGVALWPLALPALIIAFFAMVLSDQKKSKQGKSAPHRSA